MFQSILSFTMEMRMSQKKHHPGEKSVQEYQNRRNQNRSLQRNKDSWKNFWLPFRPWVIWLNTNEKSSAWKKMIGDNPELCHLQVVRKHNWMHFWIFLKSAYLHEKQAHKNHWIQTFYSFFTDKGSVQTCPHKGEKWDFYTSVLKQTT